MDAPRLGELGEPDGGHVEERSHHAEAQQLDADAANILAVHCEGSHVVANQGAACSRAKEIGGWQLAVCSCPAPALQVMFGAAGPDAATRSAADRRSGVQDECICGAVVDVCTGEVAVQSMSSRQVPLHQAEVGALRRR